MSPPLSSVHPHSFVFLLNAPGGRYKNPIVLRWAPPLVPKATAQKPFYKHLVKAKRTLRLRSEPFYLPIKSALPTAELPQPCKFFYSKTTVKNIGQGANPQSPFLK